MRIRWMTILFLLLTVQVLGCQLYPFRATVDFRETVAVEGIREITVETANGAIDVRGDPKRKDLDVQATKYATGLTKSDARAHAEKITIEIDRDPARPDLLRIIARFPPANAARSRGASFTIALPPGPSLRLQTANGRVQVVDAAADVSVKTSNGRVVVSKINGKVHLRTSNGKVVASDVAGDVDVQTSNGAVEMTRVSGGRVEAVTSNGRIRAREVRGDAKLRTSNGAIALHASSLPDKPEIRAKTSNGSVVVEVPATARATLRMRSTNGRVHAELKNAAVKDVESGRRHLIATLNGGGGSIEIESTNGSVTFRTTPAGEP